MMRRQARSSRRITGRRELHDLGRLRLRVPRAHRVPRIRAVRRGHAPQERWLEGKGHVVDGWTA